MHHTSWTNCTCDISGKVLCTRCENTVSLTESGGQRGKDIVSNTCHDEITSVLENLLNCDQGILTMAALMRLAILKVLLEMKMMEKRALMLKGSLCKRMAMTDSAIAVVVAGKDGRGCGAR